MPITARTERGVDSGLVIAVGAMDVVIGLRFCIDLEGQSENTGSARVLPVGILSAVELG
jgi:hypothetical protein